MFKLLNFIWSDTDILAWQARVLPFLPVDYQPNTLRYMRRLLLEAGGNIVRTAIVCSDTDYVVHGGEMTLKRFPHYGCHISIIWNTLMRYHLDYNMLLIFTNTLSSNGLEPYLHDGWFQPEHETYIEVFVEKMPVCVMFVWWTSNVLAVFTKFTFTSMNSRGSFFTLNWIKDTVKSPHRHEIWDVIIIIHALTAMPLMMNRSWS